MAEVKDATKFPQFPTPFGEEEQERLKQLQEQKKQMEQLWQQKFAPEAWREVSVPEKGIREWMAPTVLAPAIKAITPWEWGFDYGFTPEQFREKSEEVAVELKELTRRQQVIGVLPTIQETLRTLALSNETIITDDLTLSSIFKLNELGFNDEEKAYIVQYAQSLIGATPEQLLSGEPWGIKPVTPEELEYLRQQVPIDPRFILSTVAFSKDIGQITDALRLAYPPQGEADFDTRFEKVIKAYAEKVGKQEGESNTDAAKRAFELIAEQGQPIALVDKVSGNITMAQRKPDGMVWSGDNLLGYSDQVTGNIFPIAINTGQPLKTDEEQAIWFRDYIWNPLQSGLRNTWTGISGGVLQVLKGITAPPKTMLVEGKEVRVGGEGFPGQDKVYASLHSQLGQQEEKNRLTLAQWYKDNPQYLPKPEYQESPIEHPRLLKDPGYWGYLMLNQLPTYLTAYGVGAAVGISTRNLLAGSVAAAAVITPMEIQGIYEDLLNEGADRETATELANFFGTISGAIEIFPGMVFLRIVNPPLMRAFKKAIVKEAVQYAVKKGWLVVGRDVLFIAATEISEEGAQQITGNAAAKTINENRSLIENVPDVMLQAAIGMMPLFVTGGMASYSNMKHNLPPETQAKIDETATKMKEAGLPEEQAEAIGLAKVMETETGQAQVELAQEKAEEQIIPIATDEARAKGITDQKSKLQSINDQIKRWQTDLTTHKERLAKKDLVDREREQEAIDNIQSNIDELVIKEKRVIKAIEKLQQPVAKAIMPEVTPAPEVTTDEALRRFEEIQKAEQANIKYGIDITKATEAEYVKAGLDSYKESLKGTGFPLNVKEQTRILKEEYSKITPTAPAQEVTKELTLEEFKPVHQKMVDRVLKARRSMELTEKYGTPEQERAARTELINAESDMGSGILDVAYQWYLRRVTLVTPTAPAPEVTAKLAQMVDPKTDTMVVKGLYQDLRNTPLESQARENLYKRFTKEEADSFLAGLRPLEAILKAEPVTPTAPAVEEPVQEPELTVEFVAWKISHGERLNNKETTFYHQHFEEVEREYAKILEVAKHIPEAARKAMVSLGKLIPSLTYQPSQVMPRLPDFELEQRRFRDAIEADPSIKALIKPNKELEAMKSIARDVIGNLQTDLKDAYDRLEQVTGADKTELESSIKEKENKLKKFGKDSRLGSKTLLAKKWDNLSSLDQTFVTVAVLEPHTLDSGIADAWRDAVLVFSSLENQTGLPYVALFERIVLTNAYATRLADEYLKRITNVPRWNKIAKNEESMRKVALIIDSRRKGSTTDIENIKAEENYPLLVEVADAMESVWNEWRPIVRFLRFVEAYEDTQTIESIKTKIPDAPEEDIRAAIVAYELGGEDALWTYLGDKSWGVLDAGYSPWRMANPSLDWFRTPWTSVRGGSYLMGRDSTIMPWEAHQAFLAQYDSYNLSMALRYFLRKETQTLADFNDVAFEKWDNPDTVKRYLREFLKAIQGYPDAEASPLQQFGMKMQQISSPNIFWRPDVGLRNYLQFIVSHPDRSELVRLIWEWRNIPPSLKAVGGERFAIVVDQSGRPLRQFLYRGENIQVLGALSRPVRSVLQKIGLVFKPMDWLSSQTGKIPTMAFTDKWSRQPAYKASMSKASRATERYKVDHNAKRWFSQSGIDSPYISNEMRNHILGLFALKEDTISWAIPGLQEVTGYDAAVVKIAEEITNRTLYVYNRALAGGVQRGAYRGYASLFTFTKSTAQMIGMNVARIVSKESTPRQRTIGAKNLFLLWLFGDLVSSFLMMVTGRRRKEYIFSNTLTWSFGGLSIGIAVDTFDLLNDLIIASMGEEKDKAYAWGRLINASPRVANVLLGFYPIFMDAIESGAPFLVDELDEASPVKEFLDLAAQEGTSFDRAFLRKVRSWMDKNYTPEEREQAERTAIEIIQKIVLNAEAPDPDVFMDTLDTLVTEEARLGEILPTGESDTVKQYAGQMESILKRYGSFDWLFTEEAGLSDLSLFYMQCRDSWIVYYTLPSTPASIRQEWRESHLEEEAMMLFWGELDKSVHRVGSPEGKETMKLLRFWWDRYGIDRSKRPEATWLDGGKIVEE